MRTIGRLGVALLVVAQGCVTVAFAEPTMTLKVPGFQAAVFANGSSIVLPESNAREIEIWLQDALAEIQISTVRVLLNDVPMAAFLTTNRLPRGARVIVKLGASINPDFSLRSGRENRISFSAEDGSKVSYDAQFYVTLNATASEPRLAAQAPVRAPTRGVTAPPQVFPPTVTMRMDWPARTAERVLTLDAEVLDREGLRRVVVELNGRSIEEIVLENELPVRKQGGFVARKRLPGSVTGDGRKIVISIPVTIDKRLNTIGLRAENVAGLTGYADRVIELTTAR
jgi:hypothetical protein